jgi:hypothetical protein
MRHPLTLQPLSFIDPPVQRHTHINANSDDIDTSRRQLLLMTVTPQSSLPDSIEWPDGEDVPPTATAKSLLTLTEATACHLLSKHAVHAVESWAENKTTPVVRHHHHHRQVIQINLFNQAPAQIAVWILASFLLHLFLHLHHRLQHRPRHHPSSGARYSRTTQCSTKLSHRPDGTHLRTHLADHTAPPRLMVTRPVTCHLHGVRDLHRPVTSHPATARLAHVWGGILSGAGVHAQLEIELILSTARPPAQYHHTRSRQRHGSDPAAHLPVTNHAVTAHRVHVCDTGNVRWGGGSC